MIFNLFRLLCCFIIYVNGKKCYWTLQKHFEYFGSKTPYETIRGDIREAADLLNCKVVSIWSIHRHGNRNPDKISIDKIKQRIHLRYDIISNFDYGKSKLCAKDINEFRKWRWNKTIDKSPSHLTETGYKELYDIGKRIKEKFLNLLKNSDARKFYFRSTSKQRTARSAAAFVDGLTKGTGLKLIIDKPWKTDHVLKPFKKCPVYHEKVLNNPKSDYELFVYYKSSEFRSLKEDVQYHLGLYNKLSTADIYELYDLCRFHRSWSPKKMSPWCSVFTIEDLIILEYRDDLKHYYYNGYGSSVNSKLGGPAVRSLLRHFEEVVNGTGKNIVSLFTHDTSIGMFFTALGLFKDASPITGSFIDNNRQWRMSFVSAFAANFMAVFYRCNDDHQTKYKAQFFVNEKQVSLCSSKVCDYKDFEKKFYHFKNANLDICFEDLDKVNK